MIIIFGAGYGCIKYLLDNQEKNSSIAFIIDNNKDLHDKSLKGLKIFSPSILDEFESNDFEVHVTAFAGKDEIVAQLVHKGIEASKIKLIYDKPPKSQFNLTLARKYLNKVGLILDSLNVNYLCAYGTLLGLIRDKDLLAHDNDLDFWIIEHDLALLENFDKLASSSDASIFHIVKSKAFLPQNKFIDVTKPVTISYEIFFYDGKRLHIDFYLLSKKAEYYYHNLQGALYRLPVELFKKVKKVQINNLSVRVPTNSEKVLKYIYGNWEIPVLPGKDGHYRKHLHKIEDN